MGAVIIHLTGILIGTIGLVPSQRVLIKKYNLASKKSNTKAAFWGGFCVSQLCTVNQLSKVFVHITIELRFRDRTSHEINHIDYILMKDRGWM